MEGSTVYGFKEKNFLYTTINFTVYSFFKKFFLFTVNTPSVYVRVGSFTREPFSVYRKINHLQKLN